MDAFEILAENLFIVALLVVVFARWLVTKLQERGGAKRLDEEAGEGDESVWEVESERAREYQREEEQPPPAPQRREPQGRSGELADELRRFLESVGGEAPPNRAPEPQPPREVPKPTPEPPPVPDAFEAARREAAAKLETARQIRTEAAEKGKAAALRKMAKTAVREVRGIRIASPGGVPETARSGRTFRASRRTDRLRQMLRDRDSLRTALLLKEILDAPKGLEKSPRLPQR